MPFRPWGFCGEPRRGPDLWGFCGGDGTQLNELPRPQPASAQMPNVMSCRQDRGANFSVDASSCGSWVLSRTTGRHTGQCPVCPISRRAATRSLLSCLRSAHHWSADVDQQPGHPPPADSGTPQRRVTTPGMSRTARACRIGTNHSWPRRMQSRARIGRFCVLVMAMANGPPRH